VVEKTMLRMIKTALKPRIKLKVPAMSLGLALGSFGLMPPRMPRYEGIKGRTQGDRNESSPAPKAKSREKFSVIRSL
jgi:hypothetical protein